MVPTLYGRIQTRIVLLIVVGGIWTLIITPFLPTGESLSTSYQTTFLVLLTVLVLGVLWEFLYHGSSSSAGRRTGPRSSACSP